MGTHLRRKPSGNFRHWGEQRQPAEGRGDGFIGDAGRARCNQIIGLLGVRCQMEIGEQNLSFFEALALSAQRFLHFDNHVLCIDRFGIGDDSCARSLIFCIGEAGPFTRARLDTHGMAVMHQFGDGRRRQTDTKLVVFDFLWHANFHKSLPVNVTR